MTHPWENHNDSCECHIGICMECGCTNEVAGRAVQDDGPTEDEIREYRLDATDPENARLNWQEWKAHSAARHVGHVLGLLPSGQLVCDQCEVELGAVQDDGLPDEPTLTRILGELAPVIGGDLLNGGAPYRVGLASAIADRLRAAPPLHDPQEPER